MEEGRMRGRESGDKIGKRLLREIGLKGIFENKNHT